MIKKIIGLFCSILFMSIASANHAFYFATNLGLGNLTVQKQLNFPNSNPVKQANFIQGNDGLVGNIGLGYDVLLSSHWSTALEGDFNFVDISTPNTLNHWFHNHNASVTERIRNGYSLLILPQYHFNQSLTGFLGMGLTVDNFLVDYSDSGGNLGVSTSSDQDVHGWTLRTGLLLRLSPIAAVQITDDYTRLNRVELTAVEPLTEDSVIGRYQPALNIITIGLRIAP